MIRILTQTQYDLMKNKIKKLQKENRQLKRDLTDLQNFCINFAADQNAKSIDFPNSIKESQEFFEEWS